MILYGWAEENLNEAGREVWRGLANAIRRKHLVDDSPIESLSITARSQYMHELSTTLYDLTHNEAFVEYHKGEFVLIASGVEASPAATVTPTIAPDSPATPPNPAATSTPAATHHNSCSDDDAPDDAPRPDGPPMHFHDALLVDALLVEQVPTDKPSYEEWREEQIGQMRDEYDSEYCAWQANELNAIRTQQDDEHLHQREEAIAWREDEIDPDAYAAYHDPAPQDAPPDDWGDPSDNHDDHESQDVPPDDWGDPDGDHYPYNDGHYSEDEHGYGGHYSDGYYSEDDHGFGLSANDGRDDYYED
jgi:hypothetical protein